MDNPYCSCKLTRLVRLARALRKDRMRNMSVPSLSGLSDARYDGVHGSRLGGAGRQQQNMAQNNRNGDPMLQHLYQHEHGQPGRVSDWMGMLSQLTPQEQEQSDVSKAVQGGGAVQGTPSARVVHPPPWPSPSQHAEPLKERFRAAVCRLQVQSQERLWSELSTDPMGSERRGAASR